MLWIMQYMTEVSGGPITITDLAPVLYHNVNTVSSMIDRMEKKGLVEKVRDLADRRAIRLKITPEGGEVFSNASRPSRELIKRLFSVFSDEELVTLISLMEKLKTKIREELDIKEVELNPDLNDPARIVNFLKKWNAEH
jgi:DNA-binding MarR family transcriptional regulator